MHLRLPVIRVEHTLYTPLELVIVRNDQTFELDREALEHSLGLLLSLDQLILLLFTFWRRVSAMD